MATKYWLAGHPSGRLLAGSATVDFGSIADGDELASDITVKETVLLQLILFQ